MLQNAPALRGHHLAVDRQRAEALGQQPEAPDGGVDRRREQVVAEGGVEVGGEHAPLAGHHRREPADRLARHRLHALQGVRVLLLRHDAARAGQAVGDLDEAELPGVPDVQVGGEPAEVAHQEREAGDVFLQVVARELAGVA